jgi:hypothetical protein
MQQQRMRLNLEYPAQDPTGFVVQGIFSPHQQDSKILDRQFFDQDA